MSNLSINNLVFEYQKKAVVNDLSLNVVSNEIVCLLGASGCGKTTTLRAIAGLLKPLTGSISIADQIVSDNGVFVEPEKRNIGMMFQDYALFPHLTVGENIAFGLQKMKKQQIKERVEEMLALVHLSEFIQRYPHQLSGGQQQRVAIARALAYKPSLLLLDEPFSNIDQQVRFQLIEDIRRIIKDQKVAAIFVTHSKEEAFAFADKLAIMHQGKIAQLGTPEELFHHPKQKVVAQFLGRGIYLEAQYQKNNCFQTKFGTVISTYDVEINNKEGEIYIRPQHLKLNLKGGNEVTILSKRFIGTDYVYRILFAEQEIEVAASKYSKLDVGDKVGIEFLPHPVNFFSF